MKNQPLSRLEKQVAFILMKAGVTGPEVDECMEWAFGPDAWYIPPSPDWIDRWGKLHPTMFQLKKKDRFVETVFVVGKAFMDQKYKGGIILPGAN